MSHGLEFHLRGFVPMGIVEWGFVIEDFCRGVLYTHLYSPEMVASK